MYDVVIAGGGTAGCAAAIASARMGARTLLIEKYSFLGGTATAGLVTPYMSPSVNKVFVNQGLCTEIIQRMHKYGWGGTAHNNDGWFYPEGLKMVLEEMCQEAGVELLLDTMVIGSDVKDGKITALELYNKSGRTWISAKQFIDSTGDGELSVMANCNTLKDPGKQAVSLRFAIGNVNKKKFCDFLEDLTGKEFYRWELVEGAMIWDRGDFLEPFFRKGVEKGLIKKHDANYIQFFTVPGLLNSIFFNCPEIACEIDALDGKDVSKAYELGRESIRRLSIFFREMIPGFEESEIMHIAQMLGVRVTRRIEGKYILTIDDIIESKSFDDAICRNSYPVDIHHLDENRKKEMMGGRPKDGFHEVPLRTMFAADCSNLMVAGRCISATFEAQSSIRIQRVCQNLGEAAGITTAIATNKGIATNAVDIKEIKERLIAQGAFL